MSAKYQGKTASQVPISQHPAFSAIVALWFAALLGIGSLVLPAVLFESLFEATGIAAVIPAAAAPLGVAARIVIALVFAALGVAGGLYISRKVASAQGGVRSAPRRTRSTPVAPRDDLAKRPLSAREELGMDSFDDPVETPRAAPIAGRRRALSVTDESGPSELLESTDLPTDTAGIEFAEDVAAPLSTPFQAPADDALDLGAFADEGASEAPPAEEALPFASPADTPPFAEPANPFAEPVEAEEARPFDVAPTPTPPFAPPIDQVDTIGADLAEDDDRAQTETECAAAPSQSDSTEEDGDSEDGALADLSITELVDRFALSLQRAAERSIAESELQPEADPAEEPSLPRYVPDLGVEASEAPRFASSVSAADMAPEPEADPFAATVQIPAEPFESVPAALRPVSTEDEGEAERENDELSLTLPLTREARPFDRPAPGAVEGGVQFGAVASNEFDGEETADHDVHDIATDDGCGSLLDIRSQPRDHEFVRIDDEPEADTDDHPEPVVVFPGQDERRAAPAVDGPARDAEGSVQTAGARPFDAPANGGVAGRRGAVDEAQAERALREALQKLQRLSGAA
ncbi:hypothetical protein [Pelagerythrobacter marensis]|uniref:Uncharacterized protein n=1 Tax=Pelagerythrobacter marensis TaxID=543877 RepID=A0A0G3XEB3_9SPHN|nr:hypothetical protein [Pelagerythrobacter marensis]AKM08698.1 hypothetical protein AM2010_2643 [Pelagerythrobacter marensis]